MRRWEHFYFMGHSQASFSVLWGARDQKVGVWGKHSTIYFSKKWLPLVECEEPKGATLAPPPAPRNRLLFKTHGGRGYTPLGEGGVGPRGRKKYGSKKISPKKEAQKNPFLRTQESWGYAPPFGGGGRPSPLPTFKRSLPGMSLIVLLRKYNTFVLFFRNFLEWSKLCKKIVPSNQFSRKNFLLCDASIWRVKKVRKSPKKSE